MWFYSDPHFFHRGVINLCNRPFSSVEEMNAALVQNWNSRVRKKDRIYVLGDFSFGGMVATKGIVDQLNGYKVIVKGNHDRAPKKLFELGFDEVIENEFLIMGDHRVLLSHFPYHPVQEYKRSESGIVTAADVSFNQDRRYLHKRILDDGQTWLIHGHVHQAWKQKGRMINVGCDVWNYAPVSSEKILKMIKDGPQDLEVLNAGEYDDDN